MNHPSEKLAELIFVALDHGVDSVREGGPLIPFLIAEGRERKLQRFVTERLEQGVAKAQETVRTLNAATSSYAIAYDGYVTIQGTKCDAIMVEGAERAAPKGFLFAQPYKPKKGFFSRFKTMGDPILLGEAEQRLT